MAIGLIPKFQAGLLRIELWHLAPCVQSNEDNYTKTKELKDNQIKRHRKKTQNRGFSRVLSSLSFTFLCSITEIGSST